MNKPGRPSASKDKIISSAKNLFLEKGVFVSMEEISELSGVTRQTIYNHYQKKSEIISAVLESLGDELYIKIKTLMESESSDIYTDLKKTAEMIYDHFFSLETLQAHRIFIQAITEYPEIAENIDKHPGGKSSSFVAERLEKEQKEQNITLTCSPITAARLFFGSVMGYLYIPALHRLKDFNDETLKREITNSVMDIYEKSWNIQPTRY